MRIEERIDCEVHAACFKSRTPNRNEDFFPSHISDCRGHKTIENEKFFDEKKNSKIPFLVKQFLAIELK